MGARVTVASAEAAVSFTKLRLSISVIEPATSLTCAAPVIQVSYALLSTSLTREVPAAQIDYILLATAAYVDTTGLYQFKGEALVAADSSRFAYAKPLAEIMSIADISSLGYEKPVSDSLAATDTAAVNAALRKTEFLAASDASAIDFSLGAISEGLAASDDQALSTALPKDDSVSLADSVGVLLIYIRDVFDTVSTTDTQAVLFSAPYIESVGAADASSFLLDQQLTDAFGMNDMADVGDGIAFEFIDFTSNVVALADSQILETLPAYSDTISLSDAGIGSIQDYCDITYFAEDYVGSRFTF